MERMLDSLFVIITIITFIPGLSSLSGLTALAPDIAALCVMVVFMALNGDLDGDGQITANDALTILRASVGIEELPPEQRVIADVDKDSGIVHTVEVTGANEHDSNMTSKLLTGDEDDVYGDSGYLGSDKKEDAIVKNSKGKKIKYKINRRPSQSKNNSVRSKAQIKRREHEKSSVRAKVEHVFAVVKGQLRYRKTRYRGLRKQTAKLNMMFALANLIIADRKHFLTA